MYNEEKQNEIIRKLLSFEHMKIAEKLGFIEKQNNELDEQILYETIGLLDILSREDNQNTRKILIVLSSILWTYKKKNWDGLRDFLILIFSRAGFAPSSIMLDDGFNSNQQFSALNSLINEISITINQLKNEIFIKDKSFLITDFQMQVWKKMNELSLLGISAPTSAGKSYIILLKAVEFISNNHGSIIYIVPTLSLVSQVAIDFNNQLKNFGIKNYTIITSYNTHESANNNIYILTQEKAISAFSQNDKPFTKIGLLVVDEIQNIEKVANENDQRSKTLFDLLIELRYSCKPELIIISGPRVTGLKNLGIEIFDDTFSDEHVTRDSPVASFTYSISLNEKKYFFHQYSDLISEPLKIEITNNSQIHGYGKSVYKDDFFEYLYNVIRNLGKDSKNIIFSPTTKQARTTAISLASKFKEENEDKLLNSLIEYIKETVHKDYDLCKTIQKKIVYHHGKVPLHVRGVIEKAIRMKLIDNVVCTTTLMQGVNLPAQNIIIRNPDLAIMKRDGIKPKLTDYEIANLRGRAGRLLKDFIGRTFILDETTFENEDNNQDLFPEAEKELASGYGDTFSEFEDEIYYSLDKKETPDIHNKEYSFLLTYIRQTIMKHDNKAYDRLNAVGIKLSRSQFESLKSELKKLSIPTRICQINRYWDPIDLENLYLRRFEFNIPKSASERNIAKKIENLLLFFSNEFPVYFKRYCPLNNPKLIISASISAEKWLREKSLKDILDNKYIDSPEKIEDHISILRNKISYGLPMLFKPIFNILAPESMFLTFIETGAYMPLTRKLIELNIPRETAIFITKEFSDHLVMEEIDNKELLNKLKNIEPKLDFWRKVQLEALV